MHLDLLFSPLEVSRCSESNNQTAIIIDVLRASSTIVYAFSGFDNKYTSSLKGVKEIIPAKDIKAAREIYTNVDRKNYLLAGEQKGFAPEGFDMGNSPSDYTVKKVKGKSLVFATTNGTRMLNLLSSSKTILIGCFLNAFAVALMCNNLNQNVIIGCSGRENVSGLEDIACGGLIASYIRDLAMETNHKLELSDSALMAIKIYSSFTDILSILRSSTHGKYLIQAGFENDLQLCSLKNSFNIVPIFKNGRITPKQLNKFSFCSLYN